MINKVEICGVNTSKLPVLTKEEKNELFTRIKSGDQLAREKFIKGNLWHLNYRILSVCNKDSRLIVAF